MDEEKIRIDAVLDDLARRLAMPQTRTLSSREFNERERKLAAQRVELERPQARVPVPHKQQPLSDAEYGERLKILEEQKKALLCKTALK